MACPYFWPEAAVPGASVARAPLGGIYSGHCAAGAAEANIDSCNFGYARGRCAAFPGSEAGDAVRFSVGRDVDMDPLEIVVVLEKDWSPLRHRILRYSRSQRSFLEAPEDPVLRRQAQVFAARWIAG